VNTVPGTIFSAIHFLLTYKWGLYDKVLHYSGLEMLASLLGRFENYKQVPFSAFTTIHFLRILRIGQIS
jgi:hypothetical protein